MSVALLDRRASATTRTAVRVFRSIEDVDPAEWDSLLDADDLQATHRFIRTCEEARVENAAYRHLMVDDGAGLAAVASLSVMTVKLDLLSTGLTRRAIRWARRLRQGFLEVPIVFCGLPVSFGRSCLRFRADAERGPVLRALAAEAESFAAAVRAPVICFKEFTAAEAAELAPLTGLGYFAAPSLPSCFLELPWRSPEEWLGAMRSGYRHQITAGERLGRASGATVRVVRDFGGECPRLFALYEQVMDRAPFQLERLNLAYFERLAANLGPAARAILIERGERLLAMAILLESPRLMTFLLAGIDYEENRRHHAYLNVVSEVVAEAIRSGARALEMGQTSYEPKRRLGAVTTPRTLFLRYRSPLGHALFRAASPLLFPVPPLPPRRIFREPPS
jgi:predicted N-acyltransferase